MKTRDGTAGSASRERVFDLSGGVLCLDFANTLSDRPRGRKEHLPTYEELLAWARQAGALEEREVRNLRTRAGRDPAAAGAIRDRAIELRECVYRIFSALSAHRRVKDPDMRALNSALERDLGKLRVVPGESGFRWRWEDAGRELGAMLWPVARSAGELLTSDDRARVRECDGSHCSWLFLDHSRTQNRRWCDMKICGNRHKARVHYRRMRMKSYQGGG